MIPDAHVFFLPAAGGEQRLCIFHKPAQAAKSRLLYVHPFAEEMNKSRRMAALACRALALSGHAVLLIDLRGCGDSSADFGDATWGDWLDDVRRGMDWLDAHSPQGPMWLWGLRAGCLLTASDWGRPVHLLLWHPAASGKLALQQFLRLKLAAEMANGANKGLMDGLKAELAAGRVVEIAGYQLSSGLAQGLESARLQPAGEPGRLVLLEVAPREDAPLTPVAMQTAQGWQAAGWQVHAAAVAGPAFWSTSEIELAPALIERTVEALA